MRIGTEMTILEERAKRKTGKGRHERKAVECVMGCSAEVPASPMLLPHEGCLLYFCLECKINKTGQDDRCHHFTILQPSTMHRLSHFCPLCQHPCPPLAGIVVTDGSHRRPIDSIAGSIAVMLQNNWQNKAENDNSTLQTVED